MGGAVLDQLVATEVLPHLDAIAAGRITMLVPQRDALLRALHERLPQWRPTVPEGGFSVWVELEAPLSTPLSLMAAPAGVMIVPGSRFGVDGTLERFLRLPFSLPADRLRFAVDRIADVWQRLDRPAALGPHARRRLTARPTGWMLCGSDRRGRQFRTRSRKGSASQAARQQRPCTGRTGPAQDEHYPCVDVGDAVRPRCHRRRTRCRRPATTRRRAARPPA